MNLLGLQQKLIAVARNNPPSDAVPYAFEKRIMALLPRTPVMDVWGLWAHGLTRAAVCCAAAAMLFGTVTYFLPPKQSDNLSQDVETALLAAADNPNADAASESE
jgi:hypothetical protein